MSPSCLDSQALANLDRINKKEENVEEFIYKRNIDDRLQEECRSDLFNDDNSSIQPEDDVSSQCTSINEELKEVGRCP